MRFLGYVVLLCLLAATGGCAGTGPPAGGAPASTPARTASPSKAASAVSGPTRLAESREVAAVAVLHAWDRRRSAAWAAQDTAALRRLYLRGSTAGMRDVALLRRYVDRGVRVPGLRMQLLRAAVLVDRPHRLVLRVTERLAGTGATFGGVPLRLPRDTAQERVVELRRDAGQWRVASVTPARTRMPAPAARRGGGR